MFSLFLLVVGKRVWRDTFRRYPCTWEEGVGLSYSSGLSHFFLEHRLCFPAED